MKLGSHVIGTYIDTTAYIKDLDGFFVRVEAKNAFELRKAIKSCLLNNKHLSLCGRGGFYATAHTLNYQNNAH